MATDMDIASETLKTAATCHHRHSGCFCKALGMVCLKLVDFFQGEQDTARQALAVEAFDLCMRLNGEDGHKPLTPAAWQANHQKLEELLQELSSTPHEFCRALCAKVKSLHSMLTQEFSEKGGPGKLKELVNEILNYIQKLAPGSGSVHIPVPDSSPNSDPVLMPTTAC